MAGDVVDRINQSHARALEGVGKLREKLSDQKAMIEELVWGMHLEAQDTGEGIHPDAYATFRAAINLVEIPVEWSKNEDGDVSYRFTDLDWKARQQDRWRRRQEG